jgi:hypothetical protein
MSIIVACRAAELLGLHEDALTGITSHASKYAKILPIPEQVRRDFMHWATVNHHIYSLGRFATWRPGLMLDDLVNDIRLIAGWIDRSDNYAISRKR